MVKLSRCLVTANRHINRYASVNKKKHLPCEEAGVAEANGYEFRTLCAP